MKTAAIYLIAINFISAVVCRIDKSAAQKNKRRISEKMLFALSLLGGAVGMYITMCIIRHKTKHTKFMLGLPVIILLQTAIILLICINFS